MIPSTYDCSDDIRNYEFTLPPELIAVAPPGRRDACRLLSLDRRTGKRSHRQFDELAALLPHDALLVRNTSKVLPARLWARTDRGDRCELLFLNPVGSLEWQALVRGKHIERTACFSTDRGTRLIRGDRSAGGWRISADRAIADILTAEGEMPLPPYIMKAREEQGLPRLTAEDESVYQTVYAQTPGSVAAPTAGLHFTPELIEKMRMRGIDIVDITLHVGWGTFQPIRVDDIAAHQMHEEQFEIFSAAARAIEGAKRAGRPIVAVGSTSVRALESAWDANGACCRSGMQATSLFIRPGYEFQVVDQMITNFHTPRSSLLVMVSAFAGTSAIRAAYTDAIERRYRFYSYGDAMWIH